MDTHAPPSPVEIPFDNSYARLPEAFYARLEADAVPDPRLVKLNRDLAAALGLDPAALETEAGVAMFAGNAFPPGAEPIGMAYAGHQFGGWVPQLGDGRAMLLGEVVGTDGIRRDIQLKGSGRTPFSRGGDGRAALGPVLREYVVSEGMHALGIPTTRALAAVTTGAPVFRETVLPGAVLTRVAESHVRVGTFQYFFARDDRDAVGTLARYVIDRHYPDAADAENPYLALLQAVIQRQAALVAKWFLVGFIHGVMNTDNTSIIGETIDYGPCAFMDTYHPKTVFSSIDHMGRYAFANQPQILQWNLAQLAQCLLAHLDDNEDRALEIAQGAINDYPDIFETALADGMRRKLGLGEARDGDLDLGLDLLVTMAENSADFTLTFRHLADAVTGDAAVPASARNQFVNPPAFDAWAEKWRARLAREATPPATAAERIKAANPAVIPRNHLVEAAIRAAEDEGDLQPFHDLVDEVRRPFEDRAPGGRYVTPPAPHEIVQQTFCGT